MAILPTDAPRSRLVAHLCASSGRSKLTSQWPCRLSRRQLSPKLLRKSRMTAYRGACAVLSITTWLGALQAKRPARAATRGDTRMPWATNGCSGRRSSRQSTRPPSTTWQRLAFARSRCSSKWRPSRQAMWPICSTQMAGCAGRMSSTRRLERQSRESRSKKSQPKAARAPATSTNSGTR